MSELPPPSFKHFQNDIERRLKLEGKCEKNEHGQLVFRGYPAALEQMFRAYRKEKAFVPLVAELRKWNWEWSDNDYLTELTADLRKARNWPLLRELWAAVIAKRRTNYNKTKKARRGAPDQIPEELVTKTRGLLLDALYRLKEYAAEFRPESDIGGYLQMIEKVERGNSA
jgi:hypothetical protein